MSRPRSARTAHAAALAMMLAASGLHGSAGGAPPEQRPEAETRTAQGVASRPADGGALYAYSPGDGRGSGRTSPSAGEPAGIAPPFLVGGRTPHPRFQRLRYILHAHYRPSASTPPGTATDLDRLAAYYARFDPVVELLLAIEGAPWTLHYEPLTWKSQPRGRGFEPHAVEVYFDPRAGAQMLLERGCEGERDCRVSPADTLLHELLHVRIMLLEPRRFVAEGGMHPTRYPEAHERSVIAEENALYAAMTAIDGLPRPLRRGHTGRILRATCVICLH